MKGDRDGEAIVKSWLRTPPTDRCDPRIRHDPYWRLRALRFSHSYAKRALRGELIRAKTEETPDTAKCAEMWGVHPEDILPIIGPDNRLRIVEIPVRPDGLTDEAVANAAVLGYEYYIPPGGTPGLKLRIRASGHKSYVFFYRIRESKKIRKIKIATVGAVTLEMARELASKYKLVVNIGEDPAVWRFDHERARLERRKPNRSSKRQSEPGYKARKAIRSDPHIKHDRYWQLRARGYSTSQAKRALRGELPDVTTVETLTPRNPAKNIAQLQRISSCQTSILKTGSGSWKPRHRRQRLTEHAVAQAEPLGHEYSILDGTVPGLALRIRASGYKS